MHKNQIYNDKFLQNYPALQVLWYLSDGSGFPIVEGMGGHVGHPIPIRLHFFSNPPHQNRCPPWGSPPLKNEAPNLKPPSVLKNEAPFQEMVPRKNPEKLETIINTSASIIKQHWMVDISQEQDFRTSGIQTFARKVKQFLRKYYISWLIAQFVVIDITPLTVLFFNHQLFSNCLRADL